MWAERERWRQRVRVCIFVVAVSTLVTAWWQYDRDSRSMPALLSPIDKWISDSPRPDSRAPAAAAASPNSDRGGAASETSGVGTAGRTANPDLNYRTGAAGQGSVRSGTVTTPRSSDLNYAVAAEKNKERSEQVVPCEPRTADAAKAAPPTSRNGAVPCEEPSPEPGTNPSPPASR